MFAVVRMAIRDRWRFERMATSGSRLAGLFDERTVQQVNKKWRKTERLLRKVPGLSEHERILFARSLSGTPDERWAMHQAHMRSLGLLTRSQQRASDFSLPE